MTVLEGFSPEGVGGIYDLMSEGTLEEACRLLSDPVKLTATYSNGETLTFTYDEDEDEYALTEIKPGEKYEKVKPNGAKPPSVKTAGTVTVDVKPNLVGWQDIGYTTDVGFDRGLTYNYNTFFTK